ncbi:hypothetical protein HK096_008559, partial [Nowakowskiella sp. JEL0078]
MRCIVSLIATSFLFSLASGIPNVSRRGAVGAVGKAPTIPSSYPPIDQTVKITGAYLTAPIVTDALAIVKAAVPSSLLNIPVSTYIQYSEVTYNGDPTATCYWPNNLCIRTSSGTGYVADIYTCTGSNQWGLTYDD